MKMKNTVALVLAVCIGTIAFTGCSASQPEQEPDFSGVKSVCELSSLQCYFHNVAKVDMKKIDLGPIKLGNKRMWMEYDGIVKYGIDVSQVKIIAPDAQGVVKVSVPDAKVLNVYLDVDSLGDPYYKDGIFPWDKISIEAKTAAVAKAQSSMKEAAENNSTLLAQASERARTVLEGYVKNVGQTVGETYTVEWV